MPVILLYLAQFLFLINWCRLAHQAMPEWLQWFAWCLPSTHGVQMFVQLNQMGVPLNVVAPKLIFLATIGVIFLITAYSRLKVSK